MLKKFASLFVAFAAVFLTLGLATSPASAVAQSATVGSFADLAIGTVAYNAVGADTFLNRNAEYVDIKNTAAEPVNVQGLVVEDSWRHGQADSYTGHCNRITVTSLPAADGTMTADLPAGHTLRVYTGSGLSKVFGEGGSIHPVYMDSPDRCGYHGHIWNNNAPAVRTAPWDIVYVSLAGVTKSKSYRFWPSYYVS